MFPISKISGHQGVPISAFADRSTRPWLPFPSKGATCGIAAEARWCSRSHALLKRTKVANAVKASFKPPSSLHSASVKHVDQILTNSKLPCRLMARRSGETKVLRNCEFRSVQGGDGGMLSDWPVDGVTIKYDLLLPSVEHNECQSLMRMC